MRKKLALLPLILVIVFVFFYKPFVAKATNFANLYLRLNNQAASSTIDATVCAQASTAGAGIEDSVTITFPSQFTISSNPTNWITSISNLPPGSTAWPGIASNATSISGKSVSFSSSDLTLDTLYCFNITSSLSNTGIAQTDETGTITTNNASGTEIDSTTYAISVLANNQIAITATIPPQVSDLPISITADTPGSNFSQDTTLSYTITYGSNTLGSLDLTIQAQWSEGTIEGSPTPSVDILDYVIGSAGNAYNLTPPVIDTINRTITWNITNFPGQTTGQTVSFELKTNSNYTGSSVVSFDVSARAVSSSTTTPDSTVTQTYLYLAPSLTPTPTITPTPTSAPSAATTSTPTPTPTTTPQQPAFRFTNIGITSISKSTAQISVSTNKDALLTLKYGTSLKNLSKIIKTTVKQKSSIIALDSLSPDTNYYFTVAATDENGKTLLSDIFTFKTATISEAPLVDLQSIVAVSNDVILLSPQAQITIGQIPPKYIIVVPSSTVFEIHFALEKRTLVKIIQTIIRNKNVLGANTFGQPEANSNFVKLVETRPGIYTGRLLSQSDPGNYELYAKIIDYNGNITLQKIADIRVVNRFKILEKGTKNPVEGARVLLYLYNPSIKIYEVISPQILPIDNPSFSNPDGSVGIVLPSGKYKTEVSAIGYNPSSSGFEINFDYGDYPTIYLEKQPFNIINFIKYYWSIFTDAINASQYYIRLHADSSRLFDLSAFSAVFIFVIISFFSISARTHIGLLYLPYFLIFKLTILFKKDKARIVFGKVIEKATNFPISRAKVYLLDPNGKTNLAVLITNKLGEFYYSNPTGQDFKIKIEKEGFMEQESYDFVNKKIKEIPIVFKIEQQGKHSHSALEILLIYIEDFLGLGMESLLLLGFFIQIYFIFTFGLLRTAPFLILSIFNFVLVFFYLYEPKGLES